MGHTKDRCFALYPELKGKGKGSGGGQPQARRVSFVGEENDHQEEEVECTGLGMILESNSLDLALKSELGPPGTHSYDVDVLKAEPGPQGTCSHDYLALKVELGPQGTCREGNLCKRAWSLPSGCRQRVCRPTGRRINLGRSGRLTGR